jgi:hypothetical protein
MSGSSHVEPTAAILEFHLLLTIKVHFSLQEQKSQHTLVRTAEGWP